MEPPILSSALEELHRSRKTRGHQRELKHELAEARRKQSPLEKLHLTTEDDYIYATDSLGKASHWRHALELAKEYESKHRMLTTRYYNSVVHVCGESWQSGLELVAAMRHKIIESDLRTYKGIVKASLKPSHMWGWSLQLLGHMSKIRIHPDNILFNMITSACVVEWPAALLLLDEVIGSNLEPDSVLYGSIITACKKGGQWQMVLSLLDHMHETRVKPEIRALNSAISALAVDGHWQLAFLLVEEIWSNHLAPDKYTHGALMHACDVSGQWEHALVVLNELWDLGYDADAAIASGALGACMRGGHWEWTVWLLLQMMKRNTKLDLFSFHAAINACHDASNSEVASKVLLVMPKYRVMPTTFTYNCVLEACQGQGAWVQAARILEHMQRHGVQSDAYTCIPVIRACVQDRQWEQALHLFDTIERRRTEIDLITYSATVGACMQGHQWTAASASLARMQSSGIREDPPTCNAVITACEKCVQWEQALVVFHRMQHSSVVPDATTYSAAISACENKGQWEIATALFKEMERLSHELCHITYNSLISAYGNGEQWERGIWMLEQMRGGSVEPTLVSYHCLVASCQRSLQWKHVLRLMDEMSRRGIKFDLPTVTAALDSCEGVGLMDQMMNFAVQAREETALQLHNHDLGATPGDSARIAMAIDVLDRQYSLDASIERAFRKTIFGPTRWRLLNVIGRLGRKTRPVSQGDLHDPILSSIPSLSSSFTAEVIEDLKMAPRARPKRPWRHRRKKGRDRASFLHSPLDRWPLTAQHEVRRMFPMNAGAQAAPSAKAILAWIAFRLYSRANPTNSLDYVGTAFGPGSQDGSRLSPVTVVHDRAHHAERNALTAVLDVATSNNFSRQQPPRGYVRLYSSNTPCVSCLAFCCQIRRFAPDLNMKISFTPWSESQRWLQYTHGLPR